MAKKKKESVFKDWDEVSKAIEELAYCTNRLNKANNMFERQLLELKTAHEEKISDEKNRIKYLQDEIKLYANNHLKEFSDKKSKAFSHGVIRFRSVSSITYRNAVAVIKALKQLKMNDCITVKESINKDVLDGYDDNALKTIGATRKISESYTLELKTEDCDE